MEKALFTSPRVAASKVYFGGHDGVIRCVALQSGKLIWSLDLGKTWIHFLRFELLAGTAIYASPVLMGASALIVATTTGDVFQCFNRQWNMLQQDSAQR